MQLMYRCCIVVTEKWRADLVQRPAVVKTTSVEHALFITIRVGRTVAWRSNK